MEEYREDINKLFDAHQALLVALTKTTANLDALCKKFDTFMDAGSPRCASHAEQLKHLRATQKSLVGWVWGLALGFVGAIVTHIFRG